MRAAYKYCDIRYLFGAAELLDIFVQADNIAPLGGGQGHLRLENLLAVGVALHLTVLVRHRLLPADAGRDMGWLATKAVLAFRPC